MAAPRNLPIMSDNPLTTVKYNGLVTHGTINTCDIFSPLSSIHATFKRNKLQTGSGNPGKTNAFITCYGSLKHEIKLRHPRMIGTRHSAYLVLTTTPHEQ